MHFAKSNICLYDQCEKRQFHFMMKPTSDAERSSRVGLLSVESLSCVFCGSDIFSLITENSFFSRVYSLFRKILNGTNKWDSVCPGPLGRSGFYFLTGWRPSETSSFL